MNRSSVSICAAAEGAAGRCEPHVGWQRYAVGDHVELLTDRGDGSAARRTLKDDDEYCRSYEKPRQPLRCQGEFQA